MPIESRQLRAFALLGLVMVVWAGNSIVGRAVRFDVPPLTLAFVRWTGASLLVLPFAWKGLVNDWPAIRRAWLPVLAIGLTGIGAFNALLYSGLQHTTATNALLLQAATPALVMLLDRVLHGVTSGSVQKAGVALSVLGVMTVVFEGEPARLLSLHFGYGDALVLASVVVWAFYTVWLRYRPAIAPASFIAVTFAIGVVTMAPFALGEYLAGERIVWSAGVVGAFAYVCVLPSILAYFIYNSATRTVGPARAGQAITLLPIFGAFLSAALLDEALHPYHFVGIVCILGGIVVSALAGGGERTGAPRAPSLEDRA